MLPRETIPQLAELTSRKRKICVKPIDKPLSIWYNTYRTKQERIDTNEGICTGRIRISRIDFDGFYRDSYFYWNLKKEVDKPLSLWYNKYNEMKERKQQ